MKAQEEGCINCPSEIGCLNNFCPMNYSYTICEFCMDNEATYILNNEDCCEKCAEEYLKDEYDELTIFQKAQLLGVELTEK